MAEVSEQVTWYWKDKAGLVAGISRRSAGWMNADAVDLDRGAIGKTNRDKFFISLGFDPNKTVAITGLKHTTNVMAVYFDQAGQVVYGTNGVDGLSTDQPGLVLASTMADCFPLYFYDPIAKVVAISHTGWRGVLHNMAAATVQHLQTSYPQVVLNNLRVLIGPGLRKCHFEVKSDVEDLFKSQHPRYVSYSGDKIYIDLPAIIKYHLWQIGVPVDNVEDSGECTYDLPDRYFSFRREHPAKPQSMVAFITLRDEKI